jgi:hypothetical protein
MNNPPTAVSLASREEPRHEERAQNAGLGLALAVWSETTK